MGWRYRKSINIFPGVKLNINKKSVGVTFGGKGAHYTINSKGTKTSSVGIPGTGLYYTDSIRKKKKEENIKSNLKNNNIISPKRKSRSSLIFLYLFVLFLLVLYHLGDDSKMKMPLMKIPLNCLLTNRLVLVVLKC